MDERNITALWLLDLDKAVPLSRVKSMKQARAKTDSAEKAFSTDLAHDGTLVQTLFTPAFDNARKSIGSLRTQTDKDNKTRNPKNVDAKTVYDEYSNLVVKFDNANANAVRKINDAAMHRRADSIAQQTFGANLLSLISRQAASTLLSPSTIPDRMIAAEQFGQYAITKQRAIDDLSDDPKNQKEVIGYYTRQSTQDFEAGITKYLNTGSVGGLDDVKALLNNAANINHPNDTDAWNASRNSLESRGNALIASARDTRNFYVALFFLATGLSLLLALLIARSIAKPLISIADQAEDMASHRLPMAVGKVRDTPIGQDVVRPGLEPVVVRSRDEVADVAHAMNSVQDTALSLAVEQAEQRRNFADTFLNLGHRVQGLINRQLEFITELEDAEKDPDVLANLFKLDHLATRMRRNAESLVILAGVTSQDRGGEEISMIDTLRSALSEVDQFTRVEIGTVDPGTLPMSVASDVAHLLAELIENGLNFSAKTTKVELDGEWVDGKYRVSVADHGHGMNADQLATAARRLSGIESFTVTPSRYMGHFVAGHLAVGLGVDVTLKSNELGTVAYVTLGADLVSRPAYDGTRSGDEATVDRPQSSSEPDAEAAVASRDDAPHSASLGSLLALHRRLSRPRERSEES